MAEYEEYLTEHADELAKYKKAIASPSVVKVFFAAGQEKGQYLYYDKVREVTDKNGPGSPPQSDRLCKLTEKLRRNGELEY